MSTPVDAEIDCKKKEPIGRLADGMPKSRAPKRRHRTIGRDAIYIYTYCFEENTHDLLGNGSGFAALHKAVEGTATARNDPPLRAKGEH